MFTFYLFILLKK